MKERLTSRCPSYALASGLLWTCGIACRHGLHPECFRTGEKRRSRCHQGPWHVQLIERQHCLLPHPLSSWLRLASVSLVSRSILAQAPPAGVWRAARLSCLQPVVRCCSQPPVGVRKGARWFVVLKWQPFQHIVLGFTTVALRRVLQRGLLLGLLCVSQPLCVSA